jgi:hypothetical protein
MLYKACGLALAVLASVCGCVAFMFRADTHDELALGRMADTVVGLMFAIAFLVARLPLPPVNRQRWGRRAALGMALVWAGTGGTLLLLRAAVAQVRFAAPATVTDSRVQVARHALVSPLTKPAMNWR